MPDYIFFDDKGTLAVIDNRTQIAWLEPSRQHTQTNQSFDFTFANTSDFTKVSRKKRLLFTGLVMESDLEFKQF